MHLVLHLRGNGDMVANHITAKQPSGDAVEIDAVVSFKLDSKIRSVDINGLVTLRRGARSARGRTALMAAAWEGKVEAARMLVSEWGADVNQLADVGFGEDVTALFAAAYKGHTELARMLVLEFGVCLHSCGEDLIFTVCAHLLRDILLRNQLRALTARDLDLVFVGPCIEAVRLPVVVTLHLRDEVSSAVMVGHDQAIWAHERS